MIDVDALMCVYSRWGCLSRGLAGLVSVTVRGGTLLLSSPPTVPHLWSADRTVCQVGNSSPPLPSPLLLVLLAALGVSECIILG